jgi:hypothetical protein
MGIEVGYEAFERPDSYRFVDQLAVAYGFTGLMANVSAYAGEGVCLPDHIQSFLELALSNGNDVAGNVRSQGTGVFAGRHFIHQGPAFFAVYLRKTPGSFCVFS